MNAKVWILFLVSLLLIALNIMVYKSKNSFASNHHHASFANTTTKKNKSTAEPAKKTIGAGETTTKNTAIPPKNTKKVTANALAQDFVQQELVDVQAKDPTLQVQLRYGTTNNYWKKNLYDGLGTCYLQTEAAQMLSKAQEFLKEKYPSYSLLLWDCARPRRVQREIWESVSGKSEQRYIAAPYPYGSVYNYGIAVATTIVDSEGKELDMGTDFDYLGDLAEPRFNQKFSSTGELTPKQLTNRVLLREVMKKAGFRPNQRKWWHFEAFDTKEVRSRYRIIE